MSYIKSTRGNYYNYDVANENLAEQAAIEKHRYFQDHAPCSCYVRQSHYRAGA